MADPEQALSEAGMHKKLEKEGEGSLAAQGSIIDAHYDCVICKTGETVDSSRGFNVSNVGGLIVRKSEKPLQFTLGSSGMIAGFDLAAATMRLGGALHSASCAALLCYYGAASAMVELRCSAAPLC